MAKIVPVKGYLLVENLELKREGDKKTASGFILPGGGERLDLSVTKGRVIAGGNVDEVIFYHYFAGNEIIIPGESVEDDTKLHLVAEEDILAKEEND